MSYNRKPQPQPQPSITFSAYTVRSGGEGGKEVWTRVGKMFIHADRKGYNLLLDKGNGAEPGKLVIREDRLRASVN